MPRILSNDQHASLTARAEAYDRICASFGSDGTVPTADDIIQALDAAADTSGMVARTELDAVNAQLTSMTQERDTLSARVAELEGSSGAQSVTNNLNPESDGQGEEDTLTSFAAKNKGNAAAIISKAIETGFLN
ncbi:MAG: hypothetical protein ACRC5A_04410 [Enterobacteriaceae bacterium]